MAVSLFYFTILMKQINKSGLLLLVLLMLLPAIAAGRTIYNSVDNRFGGLMPAESIRMMGRYRAIEGDLLIDESGFDMRTTTLDTLSVTAINYRYQLRLANLNNKEGHCVDVTNQMTRKTVRLTSTEWGAVVNANGRHEVLVLLRCDNTNPYDDLTDRRFMTITVVERNGRDTTVLASKQIERGVNLTDGMNVLCMDVSANGLRVSIGNHELHQVIEVATERPQGAVNVGYATGAGARVAIERTALSFSTNNTVSVNTSWTHESLAEHFAESTDPLEGFWTYLDRDMDDTRLRLGGRYTIAVVAAEAGYDIIYVEGAQVMKKQWSCGMLKGHLSTTHFTDTYVAMWVDATLQMMSQDVQASVENGVILTMKFPVYASQVRFAKSIQ